MAIEPAIDYNSPEGVEYLRKLTEKEKRTCRWCQRVVEMKDNQVYCSDACRSKHHNAILKAKRKAQLETTNG